MNIAYCVVLFLLWQCVFMSDFSRLLFSTEPASVIRDVARSTFSLPALPTLPNHIKVPFRRNANLNIKSIVPPQRFPHTSLKQQFQINSKYLKSNLSLKSKLPSILSFISQTEKAGIPWAEKLFRINARIIDETDWSKLTSISVGNSILNKVANEMPEPRLNLNLTIQGASSQVTRKLFNKMEAKVKTAKSTAKVFISIANVNDAKLAKFNSDITAKNETAMLLSAVQSFDPNNIILISETGRSKELDRRTAEIFNKVMKSPELKEYSTIFSTIVINNKIDETDGIHLSDEGYYELLSRMQKRMPTQSAAR